MRGSTASSVEDYLAELPPGRREAIEAVRDTILRNLPPGYEEGMAFGSISYHVPLSSLPDTYNKQPLAYIALANQKHHMALYLMTVYGDPATRKWFTRRWAETGKKLDMGKSCVRFRRLDDLPLGLIGEVVARTPVERFVARYDALRRS